MQRVSQLSPQVKAAGAGFVAGGPAAGPLGAVGGAAAGYGGYKGGEMVVSGVHEGVVVPVTKAYKEAQRSNDNHAETNRLAARANSHAGAVRSGEARCSKPRSVYWKTKAPIAYKKCCSIS